MKLQSIFTSFNISASGLSAQRKKLDAISSNIANANTTRTENGEPYRRKIAVMEAKDVPDFDVILQNAKVKLKRTNQAHFPFSKHTRQLSNIYNSVEADIQEDRSDFLRVYDPNHPDADAEGYVLKPNINVVTEMVDMINASRSYEANLSSIDAAKEMAKRALDI